MLEVEQEALRPPIALEPHDGRVRRVGQLEVGRLDLELAGRSSERVLDIDLDLVRAP